MNEWKEYKLGEITTKIGSGATPRGGSNNYKEFGISLIRSQNVLDFAFTSSGLAFIDENQAQELDGVTVQENDILFNITGDSVARCCVVPKQYLPARVNQHVSIVRSNDFSHFKYVFYYLQYLKPELLISAEIGATRNAITKGMLENISVLLPPLPEQKAIASILSSLDDKIALLHHQNATLEKMAETLFRQWFVVEAKEDWEMGTFKKWINETVGGEWGKESFEGEFSKAVYCIRGTDIADLNTGLALKTPVRYIKSQKFKNIEPKTGDLIIEISGGTESQSTGRVCYINEDVKSLFAKPLVFSNFCRMIRIKKPEYSFFLYCFLRYLYDQDEFFNLENGSSGIKNLDYKVLLFELEYLMPKEELVLLFHKQVNPLYKKINQNKTQIRTLTQLRDTLLPKLMSGEVQVGIDKKMIK